MTRWYRAYVGLVSDEKIAEAALVAGVSRSVAIAVAYFTIPAEARRMPIVDDQRTWRELHIDLRRWQNDYDLYQGPVCIGLDMGEKAIGFC